MRIIVQCEQNNDGKWRTLPKSGFATMLKGLFIDQWTTFDGAGYVVRPDRCKEITIAVSDPFDVGDFDRVELRRYRAIFNL